MGRHVLDSSILGPGLCRAGRRRTPGPRVGGARRTDYVAPASHRRTLRLAHTHRARRVDPLGDGRHPIGASVRRSAHIPDSADRGWTPDCFLDVVDVFRSASARPPHQFQDCPCLGIRALSRVRGRGRRWRGAGRQRRLRNSSRQNQCRRCWSRGRHPRRHFHPLLVVPSRSTRLSATRGSVRPRR